MARLTCADGRPGDLIPRSWRLHLPAKPNEIIEESGPLSRRGFAIRAFDTALVLRVRRRHGSAREQEAWLEQLNNHPYTDYWEKWQNEAKSPSGSRARPAPLIDAELITASPLYVKAGALINF